MLARDSWMMADEIDAYPDSYWARLDRNIPEGRGEKKKKKKKERNKSS